MNKHPKKPLFLVSTLFLIFIIFTFPTSSALSQSIPMVNPATSLGFSLPFPLAWIPGGIDWPTDEGPEIVVSGNGFEIISGSTEPSLSDGTDFGEVEIDTEVITHTFTISNTGTVNLNLIGDTPVTVSGDNASDFTVPDQPSTPVAPGESTTFTVRFDPSAVDVRIATISIASDDAVESTYTFAVQGTGMNAPAPFIKLFPDDLDEDVSIDPTLSWETSTDAESYEYCLETSEVACSTSWNNIGDFTTVTLNDLTASTTYYWHVRAINGDGITYSDDAIDAFWSFTTGDPPLAFGKVSPENQETGQSTSLTLSWAASTGASSYEYCYATTTGCTGWVSVGTALSVPLSGLSLGTTYYWQVQAVNAFGETLADSGAYWSFTVGNLPGAFGKVSPANGATGQPTSLTLTWGASTGASSYEYCYATTTGCTGWVNVGTALSVPLSGLSLGTTYYWQVQAVNAFGETLADSGAYWNFTVGNLPGAFTKTSPANGAINQLASLTLSWGASTGADSYAYCYATTTGCTGWVSVGTATSVGISGLTYGMTYYWQVRAVNTFGATLADSGSYWNFTVGTLPGAFSKTSPANGATGQLTSLTLSWGEASGATGYAYCYAITTGCTNWQSTGLTRSAAISGLAYGATYYWQVKASNAIGDTYANSGVYWSFTTLFPEIDVKGNGVSILDGDSTPSTTDGTDFGSTAVLGAVSLHTFYIYNTGPGDLVLSGSPLVDVSGTNAVDFTVSVWPSSVTPSGGSTSFTIAFNPSDYGLRSAALSIANNDANENPYNFSIQGTGVTAPEIEVRGNTLLIYDGDAIPSLYDGTDFGALAVASGTVSHSFTIKNLGDANLNLTGNPRVAVLGSNAGDFTVSVQPDSVVLPGASTTFTVMFDPSAGGLRTAELSILNNDSNETPYNFSIQGTGVNPPGAFTKLLPANGATEVSTSPTLSWSASTEVGYYEYCYDTTNDNACTNWTNNGKATSVGLSGLSSVTTYYWHVRAVNIAGTTYSDSLAVAFWNFKTEFSVSPEFYKNTPLNGAIDQPLDLNLTWTVSVGATSYEYCYDTSDDDACTTWINVGNVTSIAPSGLREETTYYWQVRAVHNTVYVYANGSATAFWSFTTGDFFRNLYLTMIWK